MPQTRYEPVTIAAGANVSSGIDLKFGETVLGVEVDSAWTAADIQVQLSRDGTTYLTAFDSAASLSANTYKIVNPAISTLHFFGTNALPNAMLWIPLGGGPRVRLHSVTTTLLTDVNQVAARTLQVLIGTAL